MKRKRLIQERMKHKKPRHVVAEELGISEVYVRKIESGDVKPGRDAMIKFSEYYGLSVTVLFPDIFLSKSDTKIIRKDDITNITDA